MRSRPFVVLLALVVLLTGTATSAHARGKPEPTKKPAVGCKSKKKTPTPKDALAAAPYIAGNASPALPPGEAKKATVIAVGPPGALSGNPTGTVPIVVRNSTCRTLTSINVAATARDAAGQLIGTGASQGIEPPRLRPGEVGIGHVYFSGDSIFPPDVTYEFKVGGKDSKGLENDYFAPVAVTEHNIRSVSEFGNTTTTILGIVQNRRKTPITGPVGVTATCFNEVAQPVFEWTGFAETPGEVLEPNASAPFNVDVYDAACPVYLVGASGFGI